MSFEDKQLDKRLEYLVIGIWIIVIIALFFVFNSLFLQPLNEAEKRNADEQIQLNNFSGNSRR